MMLAEWMVHSLKPLVGERHVVPRTFVFEQTVIYQRALQLVKRLYEVAEGVERPSGVVTADHLRRAALSVLSIVTRIDDRDRAWERMEEARAAVCRCVSLLQLFAELGELDADVYVWCYEECFELSVMIEDCAGRYGDSTDRGRADAREVRRRWS